MCWRTYRQLWGHSLIMTLRIKQMKCTLYSDISCTHIFPFSQLPLFIFPCTSVLFDYKCVRVIWVACFLVCLTETNSWLILLSYTINIYSIWLTFPFFNLHLRASLCNQHCNQSLVKQLGTISSSAWWVLWKTFGVFRLHFTLLGWWISWATWLPIFYLVYYMYYVLLDVPIPMEQNDNKSLMSFDLQLTRIDNFVYYYLSYKESWKKIGVILWIQNWSQPLHLHLQFYFTIGLNFIVHTTEIPHFVEGNSAFRLLTGNATSNFQHHQTTIGGVKLHLFTILRAENDHQTLRLTLALCDV